MLLLLLPDPFRGMGHGGRPWSPRSRPTSQGAGPEVSERQKVTKERAAQRVRSWIVQNEMRGLLDGCRRRCMNDSANPSEIRA